MNPNREATLAWEERWSRPVAVATLASILLIVAAIVVATQGVGSSDGDSELLRNVDAHRSAQLISSILQAIGVGLLAAPLYYLFRAASARSETMRGQLVGVVIAAPLFLAVLAILSGLSTLSAASDFVSNEVPRLMAKGVALSSDSANDVASDTLTEAPLRPLAAGFGLGGQLGFVIAMFYTAMHAMRAGLLTRFWGSLGMALGAVSFIFFQFTLLWFVYLGLLLAGVVPGGKPPAWRSGEAEPWPTPGEKASAAMGDGDDPAIDGEATEVEEPPALENGERRKRKQRD
ncbi:MAG TPA: hypothetical protein VN756_08370 [Solirubrobacterales bacterium]|nr:hypothetical protein [Solirubrobacterales bacterium]